ncbi:MutS-related protein [Marivirga sp.]|uniref:MutS-related protein n=1 Tax=Marivirga sp. TaxID=2018662 RepID=UPI002D807C00|nr:DNA mismatch repair protein MutS [Marivirga sp.]HET8858428.1 DNA mismatch repair protein MutS [Marivirga sp.]
MNIFKIKREKKAKLQFGEPKSEPFLFDWITEFYSKLPKLESSHSLSDKVCNDLDFEELFMFLDRTNSKIGQQYLYNQLRTHDEDDIISQEEENLIKKIPKDHQFRLFLEKHLSKLDQTESFYIAKLFQDKPIEAPKWFKWLPLLSVISLLSIISLLFSTVMVYVVPALVILNMSIHYRNKNNLDHYISSLPELIKLQFIAKNILESDTLASEKVRKSIAAIEKMKKHFYLFQMESKLQSDVSNLSWGLVEIIKILLVLEPIMFFKALNQIKNNQHHISNLFIFVSRIDMLYSISSLRNGLENYCLPNFSSPKDGIKAKGIYHPLIENCVLNDIDTSGRSILLTGSNMSGKTTFIRTIAVNVLTAMALNTSFANAFQLPKIRLMSAIRISDDLLNEKSYYFEEVSTIKEMIRCSESAYYHLFLLDEIFKGTNTVERISAGKAVLSYLVNHNNLVFVSTHDIELADLLKEEYTLYHFSEMINDEEVDFDYKLKEGKLRTRNAIRILDINQYPKIIIEEAHKLAEQLDLKKPLQ